jgi:hypothetical protein
LVRRWRVCSTQGGSPKREGSFRVLTVLELGATALDWLDDRAS